MPRTDRAAEALEMVLDVDDRLAELRLQLVVDRGGSSLASSATDKAKLVDTAVKRLLAHCKAWGDGAIDDRLPQMPLPGTDEDTEPAVDLALRVLEVLTSETVVESGLQANVEQIAEWVKGDAEIIADVVEWLADGAYLVEHAGGSETFYTAAPDALCRYRITEAVRAGGEISMEDVQTALGLDVLFDEEGCDEVTRVLLAEVEAGRIVECDGPEGELNTYAVVPSEREVAVEDAEPVAEEADDAD